MKRLIILFFALFNIAYSQNLPYKLLGEQARRVIVNDSSAYGTDSFNLLTSRAVYNDLQNVYDTRGRFLNTYRKVLNGSGQSGITTSRGDVRLRFAIFGDSMAGYIGVPFYRNLLNMLGFGGGNMESVATTGGGFTHQNTNETDYWFNGTWYGINGSGSLTFTYAGARIPATLLKIYYIQESGAGTFQVQVDNGSGFVNEGSVVDANGTLAGKVISIAKTQGTYSIRINQVSGNVKIIMAAGINEPSGRDAVMLWRLSVGGLQFTNANLTPKEITSPIFADMGIDLAMIQFKENGNIYSDFKQWLDAFRLASPNTDWSLNGSGPQAVSDSVNKNDNYSLRRIALEDTLFYFDGWSPLINYAKLDSLGWEGDGLHIDIAAGHYLAGMLWRIIGIGDAYGISRSMSVDKTGNLRVLNNQSIDFENNVNDGTITARIDANFSDFRVRTTRWFNISNSAGTIQAIYDPNTGWQQTANVNTRGYTFGITNSPGIYMPNDSTIAAFRNRGAGTRMNFWAQDGSFLGAASIGSTLSVGNIPSYSTGGYYPIAQNGSTNRVERITLGPITTTSAASTLSLSIPTTGVGLYVYNGSSTATWTLPAVGPSGSVMYLVNATPYAVTTNSNSGGNDLINGGSATNTFSLPAWTTRTLFSNGTSWYVSGGSNYVFSGGLTNTSGTVTNDLITPTAGNKIAYGSSDADGQLFIRGNNNNSSTSSAGSLALQTAGSSGNINAIIISNKGTSIIRETAFPPTVLSGTTPYSVTEGNASKYFYTGSGFTMSLPASPTNGGWTFSIKNIGTGDITVDVTGGGNKLWDTSAVSSITIAVGGSRTFTWLPVQAVYSVD